MTAKAIRTTNGRGRLFDSVLETIGDTPAIRINHIGVDKVTMYVKAEFFNPASSVKDRLAIGIIEEAERSGALKPGQTVVEATSGNTGIGLAMVCAQKGYPLVVTMAESFSIERRRLMRILGAKVVLTPRAEKGFGMYRKAVELAEKHGWFLAHQFEAAANAAIHEATTGREIVNDFAGQRLDYFVTGYGTGGTMVGVSRVLRKERLELWIARCQAQISGVLEVLEQERAAVTTPYFLGERIGHSDIAVACVLRFTREAHPALFSAERYPALAAHAARCEALPPFQEIVQPLAPPSGD